MQFLCRFLVPSPLQISLAHSDQSPQDDQPPWTTAGDDVSYRIELLVDQKYPQELHQLPSAIIERLLYRVWFDEHKLTTFLAVIADEPCWAPALVSLAAESVHAGLVGQTFVLTASILQRQWRCVSRSGNGNNTPFFEMKMGKTEAQAQTLIPSEKNLDLISSTRFPAQRILAFATMFTRLTFVAV